MISFTLADMLYSDYTWTSDTVASAEELDRSAGFEVLGFINWVMLVNGLRSKRSGAQVERMLRVYPQEVLSWKVIKEWVEDNWEVFEGVDGSQAAEGVA